MAELILFFPYEPLAKEGPMETKRPWHDHYPEGVDFWPEFEKITLSQALKQTAADFARSTALDFFGKRIAYQDLNRLVGRFALGLKNLGVVPGDRVALLLPNIPQVVIANFAIWRLGAVTSPANPLYTERELRHQLNDSSATVLIALDLLLPRLDKVVPQTSIREVIVCHINDYLPFPKNLLVPLVKKDMYRAITPRDHLYQFVDVIKDARGEETGDKANWDSLAALLYTGGTTGVSKGVMLTHANLSVNVQQSKMWFSELEEGRSSILAVFPFFHSAGFTGIQNMCAFCGFTDVLVPRPEPKVIIDIMKKAKPEFVPGVPTIYTGLLNTPAFRQMDHSKIKLFVAGAAPLAKETIKDLKALTGKGITNIYGLTETSPIATATPSTALNRTGTVGVPLPGTDMRIVNLEDGTTEMPVGESGEVTFKGPQVMQGYYNRPGETDAVLKDGWLYTGDIGYVDEDGFLTLVDRKKDMIIASGFNIYPNEIDDILFEHPKILEACTIGVPDEYRGETVKAFVVCKQGETISEDELIAYCRTKLASYKVPKKIEFIDELPKTAIGKFLRRELRERESTK
jgi:long-chain acyl-CoA synthetase